MECKWQLRFLAKGGGGFTINASSTKSNGKMIEAAIKIESTGLPRVGFSIMKPHRNPQEECDSES